MNKWGEFLTASKTLYGCEETMSDRAIAIQNIAEQSTAASSFLKAFSNKNRLMVLCHLVDKELSVTELNEKLPLSQSALSQHLAVLRKEGLVSTRREAQTIYYRLGDQKASDLIYTLHRMFCLNL